MDCCRLSFHVLYTPMQRSCAAVYGTAVPALGRGSLHNHTAKPLAFQVWHGVGGRCTGSEYPSKQPALLRVAHPAAAGRTPHRRICQSQPRQAARHWVWLLVQLVTHAFLWQFPDRRVETRANSVGVVLLPRFWRVPTVRSAPLPELMDRKKRDIMERKGDKEDENKRQKQQKESSAAAL